MRVQMKNFIYKILFVLWVSALLYGCDYGLDISPTGSVTEEIYWQRASDAQTAVNAVYSELDNLTMVKELDSITDIGFRAPTGPGTFHDVMSGSIVPSNGTITGIWNRYFRGVRKANDVIVNIQKVEVGDADLLERLEAEARFLRRSEERRVGKKCRCEW